jgi:hypothetical protein
MNGIGTCSTRNKNVDYESDIDDKSCNLYNVMHDCETSTDIMLVLVLLSHEPLPMFCIDQW